MSIKDLTGLLIVCAGILSAGCGGEQIPAEALERCGGRPCIIVKAVPSDTAACLQVDGNKAIMCTVSRPMTCSVIMPSAPEAPVYVVCYAAEEAV